MHINLNIEDQVTYQWKKPIWFITLETGLSMIEQLNLVGRKASILEYWKSRTQNIQDKTNCRVDLWQAFHVNKPTTSRKTWSQFNFLISI